MQRLIIRTAARVAILAALLWGPQANAAELASDALKALTGGKTWTASQTLDGYQASFWKWKAEGTVCLWLGSQDGKCTDDGTWKIVDKSICYRFTWWLKSSGLMSACFSSWISETVTTRRNIRAAPGSWHFACRRDAAPALTEGRAA